MRVTALLVLLLLVAGCASPGVAVPRGEDLSSGQRDAYRDAVAAWIARDAAGARDALSELVTREPWYVPAHTLFQDASAALGERDSVRDSYRGEAEARPDDAARVLLAGRLALREDGARERAYRRAVDLDPASPWARAALAYELSRSADDDLLRAVALADQGFLEESRARRAEGVARYDEARELAESVAAGFPGLPDTLAVAAEVLLSRGASLGERATLVRARELALAAVDRDPAHPARLALLARVQRALVDDDGAVESLRRALVVAPGDAGLLAGLGRVLLDLGRHEEARDVLAQAAADRPDDAVLATDLGVAEQRGGDLDAARALLQRAADLAPDDPRPVEALALVEIERGDRAAARRALRAYRARGGEDTVWVEQALQDLDRAP